MSNTNPTSAAFSYLNHPDRLTAVIGTASKDGEPHAAVVYYAVEEDLTVYFLSADNTTKATNLIENPRVSIAVGFGPAYVTMQGSGTAALLEKRSESEAFAIALIKRRLFENQFTWPVFQLEAFAGEAMQVFKVTLDSLSFLNLELDNGLAVTTENVKQIL